MKLQRSIVWGCYAPFEIIDMKNTSDRDLYISLIECDGGITGEFHGLSGSGKSEIKLIYKKTPCDDIDEEDENEKGGCYVGSIFLPSQLDIRENCANEFHAIPPLSERDKRLPTKLVVRIAPYDFVHILADQREIYKLIDDAGNEFPLDQLLGRS